MNKKIIAALLAGAMVIGTLAGCGNTDAGNTDAGNSAADGQSTQQDASNAGTTDTKDRKSVV